MSQVVAQESERTAIEVAEHCPLSDEARAILRPDVAPGGYVALLIAEEMYVDAIRFTAFNLSKREAVWWGALCLWEACRSNRQAKRDRGSNAVFQTIVSWLQEPSEGKRREVETAGRDAGITTPHGQLAMAAFFSEGSMSLRGQPDVFPEAWLTAKNVASVVLAASKMAKPTKIEASQRLFLVLAAELTKGHLPWGTSEQNDLAVSTV